MQLPESAGGVRPIGGRRTSEEAKHFPELSSSVAGPHVLRRPVSRVLEMGIPTEVEEPYRLSHI